MPSPFFLDIFFGCVVSWLAYLSHIPESYILRSW